MGTARTGSRRKSSGRVGGLRVVVVDGLGRPLRVAGLKRWIEGVAPRAARGTMTLALATDAEVRRLNRRHRGIDRVTDVLSFGQGTARRSGRARRQKPLTDDLLGEVIIATGVARRQAAAAGHGYATELRILALHGLLHLLGFDHHRDDGRMARLERRLRRRGGLEQGLIERST